MGIDGSAPLGGTISTEVTNSPLHIFLAKFDFSHLGTD